jgi:hypothetical protein
MKVPDDFAGNLLTNFHILLSHPKGGMENVYESTGESLESLDQLSCFVVPPKEEG